jgi:hypothetical protein
VDTLHDVWEAIRPHLSAIVLALTWVGIVFAYLRKRSHWRTKRFADQVNFSLNYVADGTLQLRTLLETSTSRVWPNEHGVRVVLGAAKKTRPDQPFIILDDPQDMAFVKRAALNVISEKFADGFLAATLGIPVKSALYHFAVTFENFADMRTRKFRIILVEAKGLTEMFGPTAPEPAVVDAIHRDRLRVLQTMAKLSAEPKGDNRQILGRVFLGMPDFV